MFPGGGLPAQVGLALRLNNSTIETPNSPFKQVYLRLCGGTFQHVPPEHRRWGLSPPVRRHPAAAEAGDGESWPISACAEAPKSKRRQHPQMWAYLRLCGGTGEEAEEKALRTGLSPPVRRHPCYIPRAFGLSGPISACAEAPYYVDQQHCKARAYLRLCGGTRHHRRG